MDNLQLIKEQICDVCHKMWQLGWVAANDGNVSVKLPDGNFLATPTGISKSFVTPEKLVIMNVDGVVISAFGNGEIIDNFVSKVNASFATAETLVDEPIR